MAIYDWSNFDVVFQAKTDYSYRHNDVDLILKNRKDLGGTLFFDRIWSNLGLRKASSSYPPKSNQDLRNVWQQIVSSSAPDHQKHALLYYVLKDCRQLTNGASHFAAKTWLPEKYHLLVEGLWELDHCQFPQALELLTDPSLTPTFTDEILYSLIHHPKCDNSLAMGYYITVRPPLTDTRTLNAYFNILCHASVTEAYLFAKRQDEVKHKLLFEGLIVSVHSEAGSDLRAERALRLIGLPFDDEEETWFEECLLYGKASSCHQAKDSVMMRRIAIGKDFDGVGALDRLRGQKINGVNWDDVRISLEKTRNT